MARDIDSVSISTFGLMPHRHDIIAPSNMLLCAIMALLAQSYWWRKASVSFAGPENHVVSPSFTLTETPITWNLGSRMYSSVVIFESEYSRE